MEIGVLPCRQRRRVSILEEMIGVLFSDGLLDLVCNDYYGALRIHSNSYAVQLQEDFQYLALSNGNGGKVGEVLMLDEESEVGC